MGAINERANGSIGAPGVNQALTENLSGEQTIVPRQIVLCFMPHYPALINYLDRFPSFYFVCCRLAFSSLRWLPYPVVGLYLAFLGLELTALDCSDKLVCRRIIWLLFVSANKDYFWQPVSIWVLHLSHDKTIWTEMDPECTPQNRFLCIEEQLQQQTEIAALATESQRLITAMNQSLDKVKTGSQHIAAAMMKLVKLHSSAPPVNPQTLPRVLTLR